MVDESLLEKTIKELNRKWYQSDRVYRWMLTKEKGVPYIKRNKRKIWAKTIACQMSLFEIDNLSKRLGIALNLNQESHEIIKLKSCPRRIKNELI